jgi:hypothetical protein
MRKTATSAISMRREQTQQLMPQKRRFRAIVHEKHTDFNKTFSN